MKLFLSSYRIPVFQELLSLVGKDAGQIKVSIIPNAKDYYAKRARDFKINEINNFISELGMNPHLLDLRNYSDAQKLQADLMTTDLIWVSGGNTFCLRYEMHRSGFDQIITSVLDSGVVYGGESAGACVAGKSLEGLENADEPAFAEDTIWQGLGLLPNFILPHVGNEAFMAETQETLERYKDDPSLLTLTDAQVLIVDGNESRKIEGS